MIVFWAFLSNLPGGIYDWILQTLSGFHCASTSHSWRGTPNNFLVPKKFFVWALIGFQKSLFQREMANADGTTSSCVTFSHPHHFHSHILSSLLMMFRLCIQGYVPGSNAYSYSGHSWYWCFINHFLLHLSLSAILIELEIHLWVGFLEFSGFCLVQLSMLHICCVEL